MKEIKAFIKPNRIQRVIEALSDNGFESMNMGFHKQKARAHSRQKVQDRR